MPTGVRARTHTHPHTLLVSSLTPGRWTGQDTALTSILHIPPAWELPPASRSINNEPGRRGKKSEQPSQCQELEAHPISSALGSGDRLSPSVPEMNTPLLQLPACPKGAVEGFRLLFSSEGEPFLGTEWSREAGGRQGERPVSRPLSPELFLLRHP